MTSVNYTPSYLRDKRNCCETCEGFELNKYHPYFGICHKDNSLQCGEEVDLKFRCPAFKRILEK